MIATSPLILRRRRILAALCAAAAALVAALGIRLAVRAVGGDPAILGGTGEPAETAARFFNALCLREWQDASDCVRGGPELELTDLPEDPAERAVWNAFLLSWSWSTGEGGRIGRTRAWQDVAFTRLRPDALTAGLAEDIQEILARKVDEARTVDEVYEASGDYLPEVVESAEMEALAGRLSDPTPYLVTTTLRLELLYEDGRWLILPSEELWNALSGTPEGGQEA